MSGTTVKALHFATTLLALNITCNYKDGCYVEVTPDGVLISPVGTTRLLRGETKPLTLKMVYPEETLPPFQKHTGGCRLESHIKPCPCDWCGP